MSQKSTKGQGQARRSSNRPAIRTCRERIHRVGSPLDEFILQRSPYELAPTASSIEPGRCAAGGVGEAQARGGDRVAAVPAGGGHEDQTALSSRGYCGPERPNAPNVLEARAGAPSADIDRRGFDSRARSGGRSAAPEAGRRPLQDGEGNVSRGARRRLGPVARDRQAKASENAVSAPRPRTASSNRIRIQASNGPRRRSASESWQGALCI